MRLVSGPRLSTLHWNTRETQAQNLSAGRCGNRLDHLPFGDQKRF
jgi:hypothetical protein